MVVLVRDNPRTQEVEGAGEGNQKFKVIFGTSEFKVSLGYLRPCLENSKPQGPSRVW